MFKSTSGKSQLLLRGMPPQCLVSDLCFNATQHPIQTGQCFLPHPNLILYEIMLCIVLQTTTVVIAILYSLVLVTASRRHPRNLPPTHTPLNSEVVYSSPASVWKHNQCCPYQSYRTHFSIFSGRSPATTRAERVESPDVCILVTDYPPFPPCGKM